MTMRRMLLAVFSTTIMLTGCDRDVAQQAPRSAPATEGAEISAKDFGDYIVHFSAIPTDLLQPEIARTYDIVRSRNRAMLNVSIIRKTTGQPGDPVPGDIEITVNNLTGQVKNMTLRRIQEGDAIYYIGDVPVADAETLVFDLKVKPEGAATTLPLRFSRQFFSD